MSLISTPQGASVRLTAAGSGADWGRRINRLVRDQLQTPAGARQGRGQTDVLAPVAAFGDAAPASERVMSFSASAADIVVRQGLKAPLLTGLASASGMDVKLLYEFTGIDRTTVARKAARQDSLPREVAVKALEFTELVATAVDVFGAVAEATRWLTRPHPLLDGETPLQRARTPWGLQRVRAMLGALKYGGAV